MRIYLLLMAFAGIAVPMAAAAKATDKPLPFAKPIRVAPSQPPDVRARVEARNARPLSNPEEWVTVADYPARSLRNREEGLGEYALVIGPDGRVMDCSVIASVSPSLDQAACKNLRQKARFDPAFNASGDPVQGDYQATVRWVLPRAP